MQRCDFDCDRHSSLCVLAAVLVASLYSILQVDRALLYQLQQPPWSCGGMQLARTKMIHRYKGHGREPVHVVVHADDRVRRQE